MKAIGLYMVRNTLQLAYDDDCSSYIILLTDLENRYEVPIFCINLPVKYENNVDPIKTKQFE
jgi:hypothetical protein